MVGICALISVPVVRLRICQLPFADLIGIDEHIAVLDPRIELWQLLIVVLRADAGLKAVVPVMHATNQVLAIDMPIGKHCATMQATPVEHGHLVVEPNGDKVHVPDKETGGRPVQQVIPSSDCLFVHRLAPWF